MCRKAALPVALGAVADLLKLDVQKDEMGKGFIEVFSTPKEVILRAPEGEKIYDRSDKGRRADNRRTTNPLDGWQDRDGTHHGEILWDWLVSVKGQEMTVREAWTGFKEYCKRDVEVERLVHKKLHTFELVGDSLASFQFNLRMNDRGIPVNINALTHAQKLILQYQKLAHTRFHKLTGYTPTQGAKFKAWLTERGYFMDNLQSDTVEGFLKDYSDFLSTEALRALTMYRLLNFAALAKVPAMLNAACDDSHVRGTMLWHGARTGRVTGRLVQPQNMKKAKVPTDVAYEMICDECSLEDFEEFFASPLEMIASCARHFIHLPGRTFYDVDFVGVEARLAPWVVGDQDKLDSILAGIDPYKRIATMVFDVPYDQVTKAQRTISKPVELGCVYGVAAKGLQTGLAGPPFNTKISLKEAQRIVKIYRENHPKTVAAWREMEDAAKIAITEGKTTSVLNGLAKFGRVKAAGMVYLVLVLPSGRRLYYPSPRIKQKFTPYTVEEMQEHEWKRDKGGYWRGEIQFWGTVPNTNGAKWGFVNTHSSRLFENLVQALGVDCLDEGCIAATKAGFDIFMVVHDEILTLDRPDATVHDLEKAFCSIGDWAATFPLAADGEVVPYYLKNLD
jgi:DNA polymerase